ncbi:TPA: hypothetical protein U1D13_000777 [Streptococcus suis]|nr:hypothetical protein [Streptococcus suis]HEM3630398.1 hypothetical protein [Streptococcus suis]HEM3652356.1 hypothetical protein [Streptococcus suis]HEM3714755.1 hypothetical protein [Streptococcus suis]
MADKNKIFWVNGSTIKQGDTSSVFKIKLRTEDDVELNGPGKLQLIDSNKAKVEYDVDVVDNIIEFKLDRVLPVDVYIVEVEHAGYVFPSTNSVTLTVNENLGDYITDEIAELLSLEDLIGQLKTSQYDDITIKAQITDILAKIEELNNHVSYDDTALQERVTALETRPEPVAYDDAPLQLEIRRLATSSSELAEKVQALEERPDDSELRRKLETNQSIKEVSVVNRLIYDMPGFEFYNTDKSVKNLAAYLHDNRLNYSNGNSGFMGRVNHNELVAITTDSSNGTGKKLTLAYQPRRLPDNFRLLGYTDGYRYDTVRSSEVDAIGSNGSSLAIFFIGTNPTFYVMHPADMRLELVSEYNDYGSGMVRAIKHCSLIEYNSRFSISKLNFLINNVDTMGRFVEYKAILRLVSN